MAEIGFIVICKDVSYEEGNISIKNPVPSFFLSNFPNNYSFKLAFAITNLEPNEEYQIEIKLTDPNNNDLVLDQIKKVFNEGEKNIDCFINGEYDNIEFICAGKYILEITVSNEENYEDSRDINIIVREKVKK